MQTHAALLPAVLALRNEADKQAQQHAELIKIRPALT